MKHPFRNKLPSIKPFFQEDLTFKEAMEASNNHFQIVDKFLPGDFCTTVLEGVLVSATVIDVTGTGWLSLRVHGVDNYAPVPCFHADAFKADMQSHLESLVARQQLSVESIFNLDAAMVATLKKHGNASPIFEDATGNLCVVIAGSDQVLRFAIPEGYSVVNNTLVPVMGNLVEQLEEQVEEMNQWED